MNDRLLLALVLGVTSSTSNLARAAPREPVPPGSLSPVPAKPEYCDDDYEGRGGRPNYAKALACFRSDENWLWVAIMQVNGEGTPVDLAGARTSLERLPFKDADAEALERIIKKRVANPMAKARRVDFCRDVAMTTPSWDSCQANEQSRKTAKSGAELKRIRSELDPRVRPEFDQVLSAFERFVKAEGDRVYDEYVDGTARNHEAVDQEALARRNLMTTIKAVVSGPAARIPGRRVFLDADRELNAVYKKLVAANRTRISDYKNKSRAVQHEWVSYRDAMGRLAAARWPEAPGAEDQARALVTEDRISELRGAE